MHKPEPRQDINVELCDLPLGTNLRRSSKPYRRVIAEVTNGGAGEKMSLNIKAVELAAGI